MPCHLNIAIRTTGSRVLIGLGGGGVRGINNNVNFLKALKLHERFCAEGC